MLIFGFAINSAHLCQPLALIPSEENRERNRYIFFFFFEEVECFNEKQHI